MIVSVLGSGSKGNATIISSDRGLSIMIDAGLSYTQIKERMEDRDLDIEHVVAIFVTHEHGDHIKNAYAFAEKHNATVWLMPKVYDKAYSPIKKLTRLFDEDTMYHDIGAFVVQPFRIKHDTVDPVGFHITESATQKKLGYLTDSGMITKPVGKALLDCDIILLESNYDHDMLLNGSYPEHIKDRVRSNVGHLSNELCANYVNRLDASVTKNVILMHISENNNSYDKICETFGEFVDNNSPTIHMADQEDGSSIFKL